MRRIAKRAKKAKEVFEAIEGQAWMNQELAEVMMTGKKALDQCMMDVGKMMAEALMYWEREQIAGKDYASRSDYAKWGSQGGSIYLGDRKVKVDRPRLRKENREQMLGSYEKMKHPGEFSEQLLGAALRGLSGRKYKETLIGLGEEFGISPSSVSKRLIEATARKLTELRERDLSGFETFALFLDTVHRGGEAFVVALGVDIQGQKKVLGFWEGATENKEIAGCLLSDIESRGLILTDKVIYVTDGGKGIIRALKDKIGKELIHQRCVIHKDRNIQNHLPKKYRKEAHRRYRRAIELNDYLEAKEELEDFEKWLRGINESSADSLLEAGEELLTLHRLGVPHLLRLTLYSTNPIESIFSTVRHCEKNIKRYWGSKMSQRWLAAVALEAETNFRTARGFQSIPEVVARIKTGKYKKQEHEQEVLIVA